MRPVNSFPRNQLPPARRREDPPGTDYSYQRRFELGKTAVIEPLAPQPTAESMEKLTARRPQPLPPPIPVPTIATAIASRFFIWRQDPSVGEMGRRLVLVPTLVLNGPRDARINTSASRTTPVVRNADGDFLFPAESAEADCAHAFAVVHQTLSLFERARAGARIPWAWNLNGNTDVITVHPRAGVTANTFYSRSQKALKFFYFTPSDATEPVYTCRSLEIVAHEVGHAILDGLRPGWLGANNPPQTGGLHESFGDLAAIFLAFSQLDQADALIALTRGDLHAKQLLAALTEEFSGALGRPAGLRNADNDLKLGQVTNDVHQISQVFTGAIYDILADIFTFEQIRQRKVKPPVQVLLEVTAHLCRQLVTAMVRAPQTGARYVDVVNEMLKVSREENDPRIYRTFIYDRFALREVVAAEAPLAIARGEFDWENPEYADRADDTEVAVARPDHPSLLSRQDRTGCCGTMRLPEYARDQRRIDGDLHRLSQEGQTVPDVDLLADELDELRKAFG